MSEANPTLGNTTKLGSQAEFVHKYGTTALRFLLLAEVRQLLPGERVTICWRYPLPEHKEIELIYSDERERARASGTMKCGAVWICPACSLYIAERRRDELGQALEALRSEYAALMITYTCQHNLGMRLKALLDKMQQAYRKVHTGRAWQEIKAEFGLIGSVRAVEITYGSAGWHPHYHEMIIMGIDLLARDYEGAISEYAEALEAVISQRWLASLDKVGLGASEDRGLRVSCSNDDIAAYIAKWGKMPLETDFAGSANEITRGTTKAARNGSQSVWELVFDGMQNPSKQALFLEYAQATKGRSQLQWSRGLKELLGIDEIRDQDAAHGVETETDRLLAAIEIKLWKFIADRGYLGQLMTIAHTGSVERTKWFISRMSQEYNKLYEPLPQFDLGH